MLTTKNRRGPLVFPGGPKTIALPRKYIPLVFAHKDESLFPLRFISNTKTNIKLKETHQMSILGKRLLLCFACFFRKCMILSCFRPTANISGVFPFLSAMSKSTLSWQENHTITGVAFSRGILIQPQMATPGYHLAEMAPKGWGCHLWSKCVSFCQSRGTLAGVETSYGHMVGTISGKDDSFGSYT